jgi:uracil permease
MTKVASVRVLKIAALISICFAFLGKMSAILSTIPNPVLGGACLLLYGFIAVNGLRVIVENKIDFSKTRNVIITSAMLVLGLGGATLGISTGNLSISISGMSLAAIVGILLNSFLPKKVD